MLSGNSVGEIDFVDVQSFFVCADIPDQHIFRKTHIGECGKTIIGQLDN